ncbi:flagellar hook-length control protein FliK [Paraburkholderia caballeronis]|uniref:Hook-length control protein FliK n=1 Tax=Paraburkholderia caballeronis TaxID=416943 RepID=A0A1H7SNE5_9BURK|nr:flagellar hook-length control protein FliK [Paraburkholderia caballeronis]PXW22350.1 flagellar hook-length control protein FliK [Paraburkholderia caballeronis]PXW96008.1 flagellar hook-length control protein FliK [Paraburkholderia caballeronis]RAJ92374.1 flagellar hook-length control protein FliK [Paraburkholderia caballeronis]SEB50924.1 hook-length control protein FliK [Paraburkholderia caballeronis]SEL72987.1 hook-length control protein FliK [Paraburkholderia caballeronis]
MNGIDTSAAALLASRLDALLPVGAHGSAGPMQAGVSALAGGAAQLPDAQYPGAPQPSTQTVLSAVALALDAIVRSGGDATSAVVGTAPVWANPETDAVQAAAQAVANVLDAMADALSATNPGALLAADADAAAGGEAAHGAGAGANGAGGANGAAGGNAATQTTAAQAAAAHNGGPVAALAAALQRTVSSSGLFYESHIAQWLAGQRSPAELAAEPQNRLIAAAAAQLPPDWSTNAGAADDVLWSDPHAADLPAQPGGPHADPTRGVPDRMASAMQAAQFDDSLLDGPVQHALVPRSALGGATGDAVLPSANPQGQAVAVHPAVIPLLRQQLDLLATGEFRWTGEAWPGVRLDWSIRQEGDDPRRSRGAIDPDDMPWRTRLTLSLPSLGIVDADLTLVGATLSVRVQANSDGAARLSAHGDALRSRMAAAGIELGGLSIREVGGATHGGSTADAARAAHAYAQAASAPEPEAPPAPISPIAADAFDWERR